MNEIRQNSKNPECPKTKLNTRNKKTPETQYIHEWGNKYKHVLQSDGEQQEHADLNLPVKTTD